MVTTINISDIRSVFSKVLSGVMTREDADRWAYSRMKAFDDESLVFEPEKDEPSLWAAVMYLYGIDARSSPNVYLHTIEKIEEEFNARWRN